VVDEHQSTVNERRYDHRSAPGNQQFYVLQAFNSQVTTVSDYDNVTSTPGLFAELRKGLWHCTSPIEYRQILQAGAIKPNDTGSHKWGPDPYACQQLGAVSLFDFQTPTKAQVLQTADRWAPFVCMGAHHTTVVIGLDREKLQKKLVPYPANKVNTTGAVIPFVETCHCGPIPTTAITQCLLVCSSNCSHFYIEHRLTAPRLAEIETEFEKVRPTRA
jgi:hypothetical protein